MALRSEWTLREESRHTTGPRSVRHACGAAPDRTLLSAAPTARDSPSNAPIIGHAGIHLTLRERFGLDRFLPGQERMITALPAGRDALGEPPAGTADSDAAFPLGAWAARRTWGPAVLERGAGATGAVRFEQAGCKTLDSKLVREQDLPRPD